MYKVIHYFTDLQDNNHPYKVGDVFPRDGLEVAEGRLTELSSTANRQGVALIELVEEPKEPADDFMNKPEPVEEVEEKTVKKTTRRKKKDAE